MMRRIALGLCLFLVLVAVFVANVIYRYEITPVRFATVADHFERFGPPRTVREVRRGGLGEIHFELQGFPGGRPPLFAFPSDPPAYIYVGNGRFVDWCADPGDRNGWLGKWQRNAGAAVDVEVIRRRFTR